MRRSGVADRCDIFEQLSPEEVNGLLNRSKFNLMISSFESANRAMYEAMFAGVPSIVNRDCEGIDFSYINKYTGFEVSDAELADAIVDALDRPNKFSPRAWALKNCNFARSTRMLNEKLKEISLARGEPGTADLGAT